MEYNELKIIDDEGNVVEHFKIPRSAIFEEERRAKSQERWEQMNNSKLRQAKARSESRFDDSLKRLEDSFTKTCDDIAKSQKDIQAALKNAKIEQARIEWEKARSMAEVLRVNQAYQTIKRRDEKTYREKHDGFMVSMPFETKLENVERQAKQYEQSKMKIAAGGFFLGFGIVEAVIGLLT